MKAKTICTALALLLLPFSPSALGAGMPVTNHSDKAVIVIPEPVKRVVYGPHERQLADLWIPKTAAPEGGYPLAVYIHGGSWTAGTHIDYELAEDLEKCLDRGIAVAALSYRFLWQVPETKPPIAAVLADGLAGVEALKKAAAGYGVDTSRLALVGGSAGACLSLMLSLQEGNPLGVMFTGLNYAQTTLDPKEQLEWIPNQGTYGAHAFGMKWPEFVAARDRMLPEIEKYSPAALVRKIDPAVAPEMVFEYYEHSYPPPGKDRADDPVHTAQYGFAFERICRGRGLDCTMLRGPCAQTWERMRGRLLAGRKPPARPLKPFRPPAVPLVQNDTFFSLWSMGDELNASETMHWSATNQPLSVVLEADGKSYRLCGLSPTNVPALKQTSLEVRPTQSVYTFAGGGLSVELRFSTPKMADDLDVFSRPVTYVTARVGGAREWRLVTSISPMFATNDDAAPMVTNITTVAGLPAFSVGRAEQKPLSEAGDRIRCNWGYAWMVGPTAPKDGESFFVLAYDDVKSLQFFGESLSGWWSRGGKKFVTMLEESVRDHGALIKKMDAFDAELMADLRKVGGEKYARMAALCHRQSFAACKLVDYHGQPLYFSKENSSNGCMGTVDLFYPQLPHLLVSGSALTRASLAPIMLYASSSRWKWPFAPHDVGLYPLGNRINYASEKANPLPKDLMPVEECGNMLLCLCALAELEGNADFASRWWPTVTRWAEYLSTFGFDPGEQLCTDDFAGHLAHNANLSVKSILALAAYGRMAEMRGEKETARRFLGMAAKMVPQWMEAAKDGRHGGYRLAYDKPDTWSTKYNLVWDRILGLNLFPFKVGDREMEVYRREILPYGLPLDNRKDWVKLDWALWAASITGLRSDFDLIVDSLYEYADRGIVRRAFADIYSGRNGVVIGFNARSVVGAFFLPMLNDRGLWRKWASRDRLAVGPYAPIPDEEARWISGRTQQGSGGMETFVPRRNPIVARVFYTQKPVSRASVRIAALGFYDLEVNGRRLTSTAITQWTRYPSRILADTYDIAPYVSGGTNRIEISLGNGWRNPYPLENFGLRMRRTLAVGDPCVKAWLRIEYADGCVENIVSDSAWQAAEGDVTYNSVYMGETRDMRLTDRVWEAARTVSGAEGKIEDNTAPLVTERGVHAARSVSRVRPGTWLVDFGENRTGVVRARLRGVARGKAVRFRQGEALTNGVLFARSACYGQIPYAEQVDTVISAGPGEFTFQPRFTFHGFRYMEVIGLETEPSADDFLQVEQSSAVAENGSFECSNPRLNAIHRICRRTFLNNIMSVQSDCPAREKYGYGADVAACAEAFISNFDMRGFYAKTVRDNLDEARVDGWFTDTAPYIGINDGGYGGRSGGIGWAMGVPVLADLLYRYYGDLATTAEAYPVMARYAELLSEKFPDDAIPTCIGDHLALDKVDDALSAQANWVRYLDCLSVFAKRLGRDGESAGWASRAGKARSAFRARHVKNGLVGKRLTQGGQAFALRYGLVSGPERDVAAKLLVDAVKARGTALSTGLQCTNFLLEELSAAGAWDTVAGVVAREEFPGWLHMERQGATTLWERWPDPKPIHSFNHPMFGHVDAWMKRYILGVRLAPDAVGGDKVIIDPKPLCGVKWAKGSLTVATGTIHVEWSLRPDGSIDLDYALPHGTERVEK